MRFEDIKGQEYVIQTLVQAYHHNHVAHAQLFLSHEAGASLALAWAYATFLNCKNKTPYDACGVCPTCSKNRKLIHPDVHLIFPVAASTKIKSREEFLKIWREFAMESPYRTAFDWTEFFGAENKQLNIPVADSRHIIKSLALKPFEDGYKIMILWLPEYMNAGAANALLKILEEPPSKTIFLLASYNIDTILPTIISRTQIINIPPFDDTIVINALLQKGAEPNKAQQIALLADGNLSVAHKLLQEYRDDNLVFFQEWMRICYRMDFKNLIDYTEKFNALGKESQKNVLEFSLKILREMLVLKWGNSSLGRIDKATADFVIKFGQIFSMESIEPFYHRINTAIGHIERNANAKIEFMALSVEVCEIFAKSKKS